MRYMVNFDEIIALAMKEGKSIEEIAKEMSTALNEASKPKITPRDAFIAQLEDLVEDAIADEEFDMEDSIAVLTLNVVENHPDWSLEGIQMFIKSVTDQVAMTEKSVDCVEHDGNLLDVLMETLTEALGSKSKSKETEEKKSCDCGSQCHRSDDEKLNAFLKNLGI